MNSDYQEIDLLYYIKIIINRWKLIAVFPILAIAISLIVLSLQPDTKTYISYGLLEIGKISSNELIESKEQTSNALWTEAEIKKILEKLGETNITKELIMANLKNISLIDGLNELESKNQALPIENSNYIKVIVKGTNPKFIVSLINEYNNLILARHQLLYDQKIKIRDEHLLQIANKLQEAKAKLETIEKLTANAENKAYLHPTDYSDGSGNFLSSLITHRAAVQSQVDSLEQEVKNYEEAKNFIQTTKIVSAPMLPTKPINAGEMSKYVAYSAIGMVLGLFIGILTVFSLEWWQKNKHNA